MHRPSSSGPDATAAEVRLLAAGLLFGATLVVTVAVAGAALVRFARGGDGAGGDFLSIYAAARVLDAGEGGRLYDFELQRATQGALRPSFAEDGEYNPYVLPPFVAWAVVPVSRLDMRPAFAAWFAANLLLLGAVCALLWQAAAGLPASHRVALVGSSVVAVPVVANAVFGQVDLLVVAGILLCFALLQSGRPGLAGAVLCAGLVKPHLLLGVVLLLVVRREWRALAGFAAVAAPLIIVPALIAGPGVLGGYAEALLSFPAEGTAAATRVETMPNWRGFVAGVTGDAGTAWWVPGQAAIAVAAVVATKRAWLREAAPWSGRALALAALLPLLLSPHLHTQSLMLLFVAAVLYARDAGPLNGDAARDGLAGLLVLDVALLVAWVAATVGVPLGVFVTVPVFWWCAARWPEGREERQAELSLAA